MTNEIILLLNDIKDPILKILEDANKTSLLDYLPHFISALAVITSMIVVVIQYKQGLKLQQKAEIYKTKKETILEALSFLDTYISWLDMENSSIPSREKTDDVLLAIKARTIHNKLCISCDNPEIVERFMDVVRPNSTGEGGYFVFKRLYEFRNACRKELGYKVVDLPTDRVYLTQVSTRALQNQTDRDSSSST